MAKIKVDYANYDGGKMHYNYLNTFLDTTKGIMDETKQDYSEIDTSIFETGSFPIKIYIDDLYQSLLCTEKLINIGDELAQYVINNFKGAEEAIEEDIEKFINKMDELFGEVSYEGFRFNSENLVYWEPGMDGYTSQGYTETDKYKVISAYKKGEYSRLYYYDKETGEYIGYVELDNKAHVGGTTYDPDDDLIFVTGENGHVNCYDHKLIEQYITTIHSQESAPVKIDLKNEEYKGIKVECDINIREELLTDDAATIYYYKGKVYVATYRAPGDLVSYDVSCDRNQNGDVTLDTGDMHLVSHNCPSATQGISIFEKDGKTYVAFARSAKYSPSSVDVYELNDDETLGDFSGSITIPHQGLEGIKVNDDGSITGIYEFEGSTTLDANIDNIIGNNKPNPNNVIYDIKAIIWNKFLHGLDSSSYAEAVLHQQMWYQWYY